jgi:hypothetical protein
LRDKFIYAAEGGKIYNIPAAYFLSCKCGYSCPEELSLELLTNIHRRPAALIHEVRNKISTTVFQYKRKICSLFLEDGVLRVVMVS